ncbi:P-loop containing nucleoside triphosphate hydrolase protein [Trametes polyzona]|nr:P-loop containing nucleoside triphosphate hydrolase protein [Trametes polyzona]
MPLFDTHKLVPGLPETVMAKRLSSRDCDKLEELLGLNKGAEVTALGVSLRLCKEGLIEAIALATPTLIVQITIHPGHRRLGSKAASALLTKVFNNPDRPLAGFGVARTVILLRHQFNVDSRAIDLAILFSDLVEQGLPFPGNVARDLLHSQARHFAINDLWYGGDNRRLCLRAWLSACMSAEASSRIQSASKMRACHLSKPHLATLASFSMNVEILDAEKPVTTVNEYETVAGTKSELVLQNTMFKNKTLVKFNDGKMIARAIGAQGKKTALKVHRGWVAPEDITTVSVVGRQEPTTAELARDAFVVQLLLEQAQLDESKFVRLLWFPPRRSGRKKDTTLKPTSEAQFGSLNPSQRLVAAAMISSGKPLVIAHGPPGTGKTTTIAAALKYWQAQEKVVWVVAQSNVGVKNIARSIVKDDVDFKLIVSKDFHAEWHEHLYDGKVQDALIRSNEFHGEGFDPKRRFGSARIVLCTVAVLSNEMLGPIGVFKHLPVERLVVDEASQIDTIEFVVLMWKQHLFHRFGALTKVCMFGDPKQLPPYGKEHAKDLMKTIFDFAHLDRTSYLLDTQYRMPVPLGEFLSREVYESKLKSVHKEKSMSCIRTPRRPIRWSTW